MVLFLTRGRWYIYIIETVAYVFAAPVINIHKFFENVKWSWSFENLFLIFFLLNVETFKKFCIFINVRKLTTLAPTRHITRNICILHIWHFIYSQVGGRKWGAFFCTFVISLLLSIEKQPRITCGLRIQERWQESHLIKGRLKIWIQNQPWIYPLNDRSDKVKQSV